MSIIYAKSCSTMANLTSMETRPSSLTTGIRPLNPRVQRVLQSSSSFRDEETIQALQTLAEFGLIPINARLNSAVTASTSTAEATLRSSVERRLGSGARSFLRAFGRVNESLLDLESNLKDMQVCCAQVDAQLQSANRSTRQLLQHADGLRQNRITTAVQQSVVAAFLARFTLTANEVQALTSPSAPVNAELFAAMDKVDRIRSDCSTLLSSTSAGDEAIETDRTRAGLDIMHTTSQHIEAACTKLQKWAAFQARGYTRPEVEVSLTMREVIRRLRHREDVLNAVLDNLSEARSNALLNHFLEALTRGGPSGLPRPIELHAHDPIRYVGDMLAWIHQLMASEREFLESLFSLKSDNRLPGAVRLPTVELESSDRQADERRVRMQMDRDLDACGRPLKLRITQTIRSQEGSLMAFRISNLVTFYKVTIERTIGPEALMSKLLLEIAQEATAAFHETLDAAGRSLLRFIQPPAADLSAPLMLRDTLNNLKEVMETHQAALMDAGSDALSPLMSFDILLDKALNPAITMCERMAKHRPSPWDQNVYMLNCLSFVKATLDPFQFVNDRAAQVQESIDSKGRLLIDEHFNFLLKESGLEPIDTAVSDRRANEQLALLPGLSKTAVAVAFRAFDAFLSSSVLNTSPKLSLVASPRLASQIHQAALDEQDYDAGQTRAWKTKIEVNTLLGIQEAL